MPNDFPDPLFHVKPPGLCSGSSIPRGGYGAYLLAQGMTAINDPLGEHLRETVRAAHYQGKPNRLRSSFVFEQEGDAKLFLASFRPGCVIYQVRFVTPPSVVHRVCYTAWWNQHPYLIKQAHEFWKFPPIYSQNTELFAEVDLVVL
jgi:hypothetical protein